MRQERIETARACEPDRYLAALLARDPARDALITVAAFASELALIPFRVREPMMGEIRLQWWRDALQADTAEPAPSPLVAALRQVRATYDLPVADFIAMTEARAFDLYTDPMPDDATFYGYLDKTCGRLFALSMRIAKTDASSALSDHAGRAYGAARLLMALPRYLAADRCPLPRSWLQEAGFGSPAVPDVEAYKTVIARLLRQIDIDRAAAVRLTRPLPRAQRVPLLPLATIPPYLAAIRGAASPHRDIRDMIPLARIARIARAHWFGR